MYKNAVSIDLKLLSSHMDNLNNGGNDMQLVIQLKYLSSHMDSLTNGQNDMLF